MKSPYSNLKLWPFSENKQPIKEEEPLPNKPSNNTREIFVIETEFENGLLCYDNRGNELWRWKFPIRAFFDVVDKLAISPNGKYIVLSIRNMFAPENRIYFLDNTGNLLGEYQVGYGECNIAFSPDSEYVAVTDYKSVYFFKSISGILLWRYQIQPEEIDCISVSSDFILIGICPDVVRDSKGNEELKGKTSICLLNKEGKFILKKPVDTLTHPCANLRSGEITFDGKQLTVMTRKKILSFRLNLK